MALAMGLLPGIRLRGADDGDDQQRAFDNLTGRQALSLEVMGRWSYTITMDWLTPGAMPLYMGVELAGLMEAKGFQLKDLESALTSIAEPMLQMSMLQGGNDTLDDQKESLAQEIKPLLNL